MCGSLIESIAINECGTVGVCRPDTKNYQYQQTLKQGDLLLNRLQRLSKIIDVE